MAANCRRKKTQFHISKEVLKHTRRAAKRRFQLQKLLLGLTMSNQVPVISEVILSLFKLFMTWTKKLFCPGEKEKVKRRPLLMVRTVAVRFSHLSTIVDG